MLKSQPVYDDEGYLVDPDDWSEGLMRAMAKRMDVELTQDRVHIILFIRDFFEKNQTVPEARSVLKYLKNTLGEKRATRKYLYQLFPFGYAQQACKLAGMRKPLKLMLDV